MRLALIGNCQVQTYAAVAARMVENADISVFDYSQPYSRDESARERFAEHCRSCDHVLAQTALLSHTNETALRERCGDRVVTIANFYFRGLFPDSCYVGDFGHRLDDPSLVNSVVILDAFRRGLDEDQAVASFNIDTFERLGLLDAWQSSMDEMRLREANRSVDVPGAALMEAACRAYPAFLTMNHPNAAMLTEYLASVLRHLDVRHTFFNPLGIADPLAAHDTTPVLDLVAEHHDLPYRTAQRWKINALGARHVGLPELVAAFYGSYRAAEAGKLLVHSPTDILPRLHADPELRFLVDAGSAAPASTAPPPVPRPQGPQVELIRHEMARAVSSLRSDLKHLSVYVHKVHSFLEVIDPKVERLVYELATPTTDAATPTPSGPAIRSAIRSGTPNRRPIALVRRATRFAAALLANRRAGRRRRGGTAT